MDDERKRVTVEPPNERLKVDLGEAACLAQETLRAMIDASGWATMRVRSVNMDLSPPSRLNKDGDKWRVAKVSGILMGMTGEVRFVAAFHMVHDNGHCWNIRGQGELRVSQNDVWCFRMTEPHGPKGKLKAELLPVGHPEMLV